MKITGSGLKNLGEALKRLSALQDIKIRPKAKFLIASHIPL